MAVPNYISTPSLEFLKSFDIVLPVTKDCYNNLYSSNNINGVSL